MNALIQSIVSSQIRSDIPEFKVGDAVRVYAKVREGEKERVQLFAGIVLARRGGGINETFTVRRISHGEGVERVFPVHSKMIEKIEVERDSVPGRARRYYLRDRIGKSAMQVVERRSE